MQIISHEIGKMWHCQSSALWHHWSFILNWCWTFSCWLHGKKIVCHKIICQHPFLFIEYVGPGQSDSRLGEVVHAFSSPASFPRHLLWVCPVVSSQLNMVITPPQGWNAAQGHLSQLSAPPQLGPVKGMAAVPWATYIFSLIVSGPYPKLMTTADGWKARCRLTVSPSGSAPTTASTVLLIVKQSACQSQAPSYSCSLVNICT